MQHKITPLWTEKPNDEMDGGTPSQRALAQDVPSTSKNEPQMYIEEPTPLEIQSSILLLYDYDKKNTQARFSTQALFTPQNDKLSLI